MQPEKSSAQDMTVHWHPTTESYLDARFTVIKATEGLGVSLNEDKSDLLEVYVDSVGIPTIGTGFNIYQQSEKGDAPLRDAVLTSIFEAGNFAKVKTALDPLLSQEWVFGKPGTRALRAATKKALDSLSITDLPIFKFRDEQHIRSFFDTDPQAAVAYEQALTKRLAALGVSDVPRNTYERVALLSITWNGGTGILKQGIAGALASGNRAEVWYELRYNSNLKKDHGIAVRRAYEAQVFGLYDKSKDVTQIEAENIVRMYATHRGVINAYEAKFGVRRYWAEANENYLLKSTSLFYVPELKEALLPALKRMTQLYPEAQGMDILLGTTKDDHLVVNSDSAALIGDLGNDVLIGGSGNDMLRGGAGNDRLDGKAGVDRYLHIGNFPGVDTIVRDKDGVIEFNVTGAPGINNGGSRSIEGDYYINSAGTAYIEKFFPSGGDGYPNRLIIQQTPQGMEIGNILTGNIDGPGSPDATDKITIEGYVNGDLGINLLNATCRDAGKIIDSPTGGNIQGTCGSDLIMSDVAQMLVEAGQGNDIISLGDNFSIIGNNNLVSGGTGSDRIDTRAGDDQINSGEGRDDIDPGVGNDVVHGDAGDDQIHESFVTPLTTTAARQDIDVFYGDDGNDEINAAYGRQKIYGGGGNDKIFLESADGTAEENILDGGDGADNLIAYNSNVVFIGGTGINTYTVYFGDLANGKIIEIRDGRISNLSSIFIVVTGSGTYPIEQFGDIKKTYNKDGTLVVQLTSEDALNLTASPQATVQGKIIIRDFYDGMFGIYGVEGAPPAPWQIPIAHPEEPALGNTIYLPLLRKSGSTQAQAVNMMAHPVAQAHPEQVAYTAPAASATAGLMMMGVAVRAAPPRFFQPVHRAFERAQRELDITRIRAERAFTGFKARIGNQPSV